MLGFSSFHRDTRMGSGTQNRAPGPGERLRLLASFTRSVSSLSFYFVVGDRIAGF